MTGDNQRESKYLGIAPYRAMIAKWNGREPTTAMVVIESASKEVRSKNIIWVCTSENTIPATSGSET